MNTHRLTPHRRSLAPAWVIAGVLIAAGIVGVGLASRGTVHHPLVAVTLGALATVSYLADRRFALPTWRLEADLPIWFVAVLSCGPLWACLIVCVPELLRPWLERERPPRRVALAAGVASYLWAVLAGTLALTLLPGAHASSIVERWPSYVVACSAMVLLNVAINAGIVHCVVDRGPLPWRHFSAMLVFAPLAGAIACLFIAFGLPALGLFAAVAWLPGLLVRAAMPLVSPPAGTLDHATATAYYARAIADELGLPRRRRRGVALATGREPWISRLIPSRIFADRHHAGELHFELGCHDRWPAETRLSVDGWVLDLARQWAALTASGTAQLSHTAALRRIETGPRPYHPETLRAAWRVVNAQPVAARTAAHAPKGRALARRVVALANPSG